MPSNKLSKLSIKTNVSQFQSDINSLPGQPLVLHEAVSSKFPEQFAPPFCGVGFVHDLDLETLPPPHVTGHDVHEDQLSKPPSTESKNILLLPFQKSKYPQSSNKVKGLEYV